MSASASEQQYPIELREIGLDPRVRCVVMQYATDPATGLPITGRGMFARETIPANTLIEVCPIVPIYKGEQWRGTNALYSYIFNWNVDGPNGEEIVTGGCSLGYGAVYNHSEDPNTRTERLLEQYLLEFYTTREVVAGEELTHDYGWSNTDVGFRLDHIDPYMRPLGMPVWQPRGPRRPAPNPAAEDELFELD